MVTGIGGMEMKTKFNVGDNIWTIKQVNKYIKCPKCKGNSKELIGNIEYHCANCYGTGKKLTQELEWIVQKENPCKITRIRLLQDENRIYIDYLGGTNIFNADYLGAEQDCFATKAEAQKECDRRNGK
jgi:DNA-directed RNA polymerase subunit RPC12/RpoP